MVSKIDQIKLEISDCHDNLNDSFIKIIERKDQIEELKEKSNKLKENSRLFDKQTKKLKWKNWWKKSKHNIFIGFATIVIIGLIVLTIII
jgi:hypothetical protein